VDAYGWDEFGLARDLELGGTIDPGMAVGIYESR
jgi:hypothetical protein